MARFFFVTGALSALLAVTLGAFGAHGLRHRLDAGPLSVFEVGVRYQMFHALALLAVAWARTRWPSATADVAGWSFVAGTVIFSGSLYALSVTGERWLGAVTPFGGVAFLIGWAALAWTAWRGSRPA
jgi:uncharacterized membrane protein YgdD (TMEM256/DUF423 family)